MHIVIEGGVAGSGSVQPLDTGINLEVTPIFLDENTIQMRVFAQWTFLESDLSQVSSIITGTSFAKTSKTFITSNLTLKYDEAMILSGLSDQEKEKLDDKTPEPGDILLIQYLFRNKTATKSKKTVIVHWLQEGRQWTITTRLIHYEALLGKLTFNLLRPCFDIRQCTIEFILQLWIGPSAEVDVDLKLSPFTK